jgi:hypothetical protein
LVELEGRVRHLSGATTAREALVALGTRYLNLSSGTDPQLANAWLRMVELLSTEGAGDSDAAHRHFAEAAARLQSLHRSPLANPDLALQLASAITEQIRTIPDFSSRIPLINRVRRILLRYPQSIPHLHCLAQLLILSRDEEAALAIERRIASALRGHSPVDRFALARTLFHDAQQIQSSSNPALRAAEHEEAISLLDRLIDDEQTHVRYRLQRALSRVRHSDALLRLKKKSPALVEAEQGIAEIRQLLREDPRRSSLALTLADESYRYTSILVAAGERARGTPLLLESSSRMRQIRAANPQVLRYAITHADCLSNLAFVHRNSSDYSSDTRFQEEAIDILTAEQTRHPGNQQLQRELVQKHLSASVVRRFSRQYPEAAKHLDQAWLLLNPALRTKHQIEDHLNAADWFDVKASLESATAKSAAALSNRQIALQHLNSAQRLGYPFPLLLARKIYILSGTDNDFFNLRRYDEAIALNDKHLPEFENHLSLNPNHFES